MASITPLKTRSGLQIGCMYQPKPAVHHDRDALRLQAALLRARQPSGVASTVAAWLRRLWAWC